MYIELIHSLSILLSRGSIYPGSHARGSCV